MNHKQQRLLESLFKHPTSGNIHWREIEYLLKSLDAEFHESPGSRFRVILNGVEDTLHRPHHGATLTKQDVRHLRNFLHNAGVG